MAGKTGRGRKRAAPAAVADTMEPVLEKIADSTTENLNGDSGQAPLDMKRKKKAAKSVPVEIPDSVNDEENAIEVLPKRGRKVAPSKIESSAPTTPEPIKKGKTSASKKKSRKLTEVVDEEEPKKLTKRGRGKRATPEEPVEEEAVDIPEEIPEPVVEKKKSAKKGSKKEVLNAIAPVVEEPTKSKGRRVAKKVVEVQPINDDDDEDEGSVQSENYKEEEEYKPTSFKRGRNKKEASLEPKKKEKPLKKTKSEAPVKVEQSKARNSFLRINFIVD